MSPRLSSIMGRIPVNNFFFSMAKMHIYSSMYSNMSIDTCVCVWCTVHSSPVYSFCVPFLRFHYFALYNVAR